MPFTDSSLGYLNDYGYNVVRLPSRAIDPLLVLAPDRDHLDVLGPLSDLLIDPGPVPPVTYNQERSDIAGRRSDRYGANVGLKILDRLLTPFGVRGSRLETSLKAARSIDFCFEEVFSDFIYVTELSRYLAQSVPDLANSVVNQFTAKGRAFVIIETIKSKSFGVTAYNQKGSAISIKIAEVQKILSAKAKATLAVDDSRTISFVGKKQLRFGFKMVPIQLNTKTGVARLEVDRSHNINTKGRRRVLSVTSSPPRPRTIGGIQQNDLMETESNPYILLGAGNLLRLF